MEIFIHNDNTNKIIYKYNDILTVNYDFIIIIRKIKKLSK
jgi:hypothetical protein